MDDSIAFLLSDVSRLIRRRFDDRARSIGVTRAQWRTLTALSRREGLTQGALAELLEVEPITLCRMIDRLEEAGHVERRRSPIDRRAWNIYLTAQSRPLLGQLRTIADEVIERSLCGLGEAERTALKTALDHVRRNLTDTDTKDLAHG